MNLDIVTKIASHHQEVLREMRPQTPTVRGWSRREEFIFAVHKFVSVPISDELENMRSLLKWELLVRCKTS
jgi:hypothetical protein